MNQEQPHANVTESASFPPVCGAKTRNGGRCKNPPANGYRRCRMHGGAKGSGAPKGNTNAMKHGLYSSRCKKLEKCLRGMETGEVKPHETMEVLVSLGWLNENENGF